MLGNLLGGFMILIVGIALMPMVANQVQFAISPNGTQVTNVSGASSIVLGISTLMYAITISSCAIGVGAMGLRNAGLI
jgi:hypothetical protein